MGQNLLLLIHFIASGTILTLMRAAAQKDADPFVIAWVVAATTTVFGLLIALSGPFEVGSVIGTANLKNQAITGALIFGVLGGAYLASSYSRMMAQKILPSYVEGPLSRLSLLIVIAMSVAFLGEKRTILQLTGIALAFVPLILSHINLKNLTDKRSIAAVGIVWILLATICAASVQISSKLLVDPKFGAGIPPLVFVIMINLSTAVLSSFIFAGRSVLSRSQPLTYDLRKTIYLGTIVGGLNVIGFTSQAMFLVRGDATIIFPVSALTIIVPTLYFGLTRREQRPTLREIISVALAIAAILMIVLEF